MTGKQYIKTSGCRGVIILIVLHKIPDGPVFLGNVECCNAVLAAPHPRQVLSSTCGRTSRRNVASPCPSHARRACRSGTSARLSPSVIASPSSARDLETSSCGALPRWPRSPPPSCASCEANQHPPTCWRRFQCRNPSLHGHCPLPATTDPSDSCRCFRVGRSPKFPCRTVGTRHVPMPRPAGRVAKRLRHVRVGFHYHDPLGHGRPFD